MLAAAGSSGQPSSSGAAAASAAAAPLRNVGVPHLVHPQGAAVNNAVPLELTEFRRGVGLCIYRSDGLVFAARRMDDTSGSWQMPQVLLP